jgi:hypothetical protein
MSPLLSQHFGHYVLLESTWYVSMLEVRSRNPEFDPLGNDFGMNQVLYLDVPCNSYREQGQKALKGKCLIFESFDP